MLCSKCCFWKSERKFLKLYLFRKASSRSVVRKEIPAASSFQKPRKSGHLTKLCGRRWFFRAAWKRRYCVLDGNKLYYYDNETSRGTESGCGAISLDYFDICDEQDSKKTPNVFALKSSLRGLFEVSHVFSADTLSDMCDWIGLIKASIQESKVNGNNSTASQLPTAEIRKKSTDMQEVKAGNRSTFDDLPEAECLSSMMKDRARPPGRRPPKKKPHVTQDADEVDAAHLSAVTGVLEEQEVREEVRRNSVRVYEYSSSEESAASRDLSSTSPMLRPSGSRKRRDVLSAIGSHHVSQPDMLNDVSMINGTGDSPVLEGKGNPRWTVSSSCLPKPRQPATGPGGVMNLLQLNDQIANLEKDLNVAKADVGKVQENLTVVHSAMDSATEKVAKAVEKAQEYENQMSSLLQQIQALVQEASCLLKEAKEAKEEFLTLKNKPEADEKKSEE